ncbi:lytic murein transglycosylase [Streptomyces roseoverticillatus]|uniref:lytic transglycosylase domain-containing protein n=1 Tax=Streptomyces roseoverticillatus TaxID=66429 RepID=UPI0006936CE9|nr:lytic murein transglycosylase [Streptomyces roseoverticillatus]
MKILPTRAASVSRQGLCTALLVASLTAAVGAGPPHNTADADDPAKDPKNPQGMPHGTPNLTLPDLRPNGRPGLPGASGPGKEDTKDAATGIPATALDAYRKAAQRAAADMPGCHMPWELIAGIGQVETQHATYNGARMTADGTTDKPILGPQLDGNGFATVKDTDQGLWDGDTVYDKAVGPTQFLPSTWAQYGADGNGDGVKNPNNIYDAALGTAKYLCAGGKDMNRAEDLDRAILSYNNSRSYVNAVTEWMRAYQQGNVPSLPDRTGVPSGNTPSGNAPSRNVPSGNMPSGNAPSGNAPSTKPQPSKPVPPSSGKPTPADPGNKPSTPPAKPPTKPEEPHKPTPPTPPTQASRLERVGDGKTWETTAGETFKERARVLVKDKSGKPMAGAPVRFVVSGDGAAFADASTELTVTTGKDGTATAPPVVAGLKIGKVKVAATVAGRERDVPAVEFTGTVSVRAAEKVIVVGEPDLKADPNGAFADRITVKVLAKDGKDVIGSAVTAKITKLDGTTPAAKEGPCFKGPDGKRTWRLEAGTTDKDGVLTLPQLLTDGHSGEYLLTVTTGDGKVLSLRLLVKAPTAPPPTTPSTKPTPAA